MERVNLRPCEIGTYRCAHADCSKWAVVVETIRVQPNGMPSSLAFYGACEDHLPE